MEAILRRHLLVFERGGDQEVQQQVERQRLDGHEPAEDLDRHPLYRPGVAKLCPISKL